LREAPRASAGRCEDGFQARAEISRAHGEAFKRGERGLVTGEKDFVPGEEDLDQGTGGAGQAAARVQHVAPSGEALRKEQSELGRPEVLADDRRAQRRRKRRHLRPKRSEVARRVMQHSTLAKVAKIAPAEVAEGWLLLEVGLDAALPAIGDHAPDLIEIAVEKIHAAAPHHEPGAAVHEGAPGVRRCHDGRLLGGIVQAPRRGAEELGVRRRSLLIEHAKIHIGVRPRRAPRKGAGEHHRPHRGKRSEHREHTLHQAAGRLERRDHRAGPALSATSRSSCHSRIRSARSGCGS